MRFEGKGTNEKGICAHVEWHIMCYGACTLLSCGELPDTRGALQDLLERKGGAECFEQGLVIPEVLRPYMQGREFLRFVKELPKGVQKKQ